MGNYFQTPDKILRKALKVLHAKLNFIGTIHRDYDDQFASSGLEGKIGATLRIRLPEQYTVTTGATYVPQAITQNSVTMTVATQKHVGLKLTSADLALKDEDFEERHIIPAMSALATTMENDALSGLVPLVYNMCGGAGGGAPTTMYSFGQMRALLNKNLAPDEGKRVVLMDSDTSAAMADGLKALFNDRRELSHAYLEGYLTRGQGFTFMENDLMPVITNGTRVATVNTGAIGTAPANGATSMTITSFAGGATINAGEVFTIYPAAGVTAGVFAVHPETKTPYTNLQQFTVTTTVAIGASGTLTFTPPINYTADGFQNVSRKPTTSDYVQFLAATPPAVGGSGTASTGYQQLLAYHKDAFAFVTADLPIYDGQVFMARKTIDKLSMRIWKFADGVNDSENTRIDVLYGFTALRPQLAVRYTK